MVARRVVHTCMLHSRGCGAAVLSPVVSLVSGAEPPEGRHGPSHPVMSRMDHGKIIGSKHTVQEQMLTIPVEREWRAGHPVQRAPRE